MKKIIFINLVFATAFLSAETKAVKEILLDSITSSSKEGWESSGSGGYVFETLVDLIGDDPPERLVNFSIDERNGFHVFAAEDDRYLGSIDWILLDQPRSKNKGVTTIFSVDEGSNYASGDEKPFTKKVLSTKISSQGIETSARIAGYGPGDIADAQFNAIRNNPKSIQGALIQSPQIRFTTLESFLSDKAKWMPYNPDEWVKLGQFPLLKSKAKSVRKIKSSSDEEEIRILIGDFTLDRASELLSKTGPQLRERNTQGSISNEEITGTKRNATLVNQLQSEQKEPEKKSSLPWIIAGVLLVGIFALLLKTFKGKSTS